MSIKRPYVVYAVIGILVVATVAGISYSVIETGIAAEMSNRVAALEVECASLNEQLTETTANLTTTMEECHQLELEYDTLRAQCDALNVTNQQLLGNITTLESQIATLESQISTLQTQVSDLETQVADLEAQVATLEAQVAQLQSDNAALQAQVDSLTAQVNSLNSLLVAANATIAMYEHLRMPFNVFFHEMGLDQHYERLRELYCAPRWHYDSIVPYSFDAPGASYAYIGPVVLPEDELWLLDLEVSGGTLGNIEFFITDPTSFTRYQSNWMYPWMNKTCSHPDSTGFTDERLDIPGTWYIVFDNHDDASNVHIEFNITIYEHYLNWWDGRWFATAIALHDAGDAYWSGTCDEFGNSSCILEAEAFLFQLADFITSETGVQLANDTYTWIYEWLEYTYDVDTDADSTNEYIRAALETLSLGYGDCEDQAIAAAAMLQALGFDVGIGVWVHSTWGGHCWLAVKGDSWFPSTQLWRISDLLSSSTYIYGDTGDVWLLLDPTWNTPFGTDPAWVSEAFDLIEFIELDISNLTDYWNDWCTFPISFS